MCTRRSPIEGPSHSAHQCRDLLTNWDFSAWASRHRPHRLDPQDAGERNALRQTKPGVQFGPVEAERGNLDQHLPR